jgi:antitoxin component YwqK of YwqJK toxin-antitoxin module
MGIKLIMIKKQLNRVYGNYLLKLFYRRIKVMRKLTVFIITSVFLITTCGKGTKEDQTAPKIKITGNVMEIFYPEGPIQGKGGFKTIEKDGKKINKKDGEWTLYVKESNGKVVSAKGVFSEDKRNGKWIFYYPNGAVKSESTYVDGKQNGISKSYNKNGKVTAEIPYKDDKVNGTRILYTDEGVKQKEEQVKDNKRNGKSTTYFKNGKIQISAVYSNDKLDGNWTEYYEDGKKKMEGRQIPVTEEKIKEDAKWAEKEGLKTGPWTLYHRNGKKLMTGVYEDNKMTGKWLAYAPEGYLESEGNYENNTKNGPW